MKTLNLLKLLILGAALPLAAGCTSSSEVQTDVAAAEKHAETGEAEKHGHTHGGWWCGEHGVPESMCGLCDSKLAADFQRKGDWCEKHERPDSQCFECHPEYAARFAAMYEAKYGEQPPKLEE
jgi:hypothetical protein